MKLFKDTVIILHEYGAPSHYNGLKKLLNDCNKNLFFFEFDLARSFKKIFRERSLKSIRRFSANLLFMAAIKLRLIRNLKVLIGMAPFDKKIRHLKNVLNNNQIYWHNSWPEWNLSNWKSMPYATDKIPDLWEAFFNQVDHAFFVTDHAKKSFQDNLKFQFPISVVHHSYNATIFNDQNREIRDSFQPLKLIYVGRIVRQKGINKIFEISKTLGKNVSIEIIGSGCDLSTYKRIFEATTRFFGSLPQKEVARKLNGADILLMPSIRESGWQEAFGISIIEAMACGVIPIATDHPGPLEILSDFDIALTSSEEKFCDSACFLINKFNADRKFLSNISKQCIEISKAYSCENISKKWKPILDDNIQVNY